jgi:hypothetical protein
VAGWSTRVTEGNPEAVRNSKGVPPLTMLVVVVVGGMVVVREIM